MTVYDVHTLPAAGPVRHFQPYATAEAAERMRMHLSAVLHADLVVEPVDDAAWVARLLGREVAG